MNATETVALDTNGIDTVVVASIDMQGRLFGRRMSSAKFLQIAERGINASSCALGWDYAQSTGLGAEYTGYHTGWHDLRLVPDLGSFRHLPWLESTAICLSNVFAVHSDEPVEVAPRRVLERQVNALDRAGLHCSIGLEIEFFVFDDSHQAARAKSYGGLAPSTTKHAQDLINSETNAWEPFFRKLRQDTVSAGLNVTFSQTEWGEGQWEINLDRQDPLRAADEFTLFKLAAKDIARLHGASITFMARPMGTSVGSSCHINLSLWNNDGANIFFDKSEPEASNSMRHAIGGLLTHTPALMFFYAPNVNSYKRTTSKLFAGNGRTWGLDNRTVSCRVVGNTPDDIRIEFRVPGADVNPYFALAAVLASVKDGLDQRLDPGLPVTGNGFLRDESSTFPRNLGAAAAELKNNHFAISSFGRDVVSHASALAQYEWSEFMDAVTDWERVRYFDAV